MLLVASNVKDTPRERNEPATQSDNSWIRGSLGSTRPGSTDGKNPLQLLHQRLGYISRSAILNILKKNAVKGAGITYNSCKKMQLGMNEALLRSTMTTDHLPSSRSNDMLGKPPFSHIGWDPVPMGTRSIHGNYYCNIGIDFNSKLLFAYHRNNKGKQAAVLDSINHDYCKHFGYTIGNAVEGIANIKSG